MSNDRLITEAWYDFMGRGSEGEEEAVLGAMKAEELIKQKKAQIEKLKEEIKELEMQMSFDLKDRME
jgi:hypothetical protein